MGTAKERCGIGDFGNSEVFISVECGDVLINLQGCLFDELWVILRFWRLGAEPTGRDE
jgi:hypothetical protein